ncbi:hypothetical protein PF003_g38594 [Phytophthora fragariae]|nr:hypothetical protein PF003_g38594 [Phytophthora fragariae]
MFAVFAYNSANHPDAERINDGPTSTAPERTTETHGDIGGRRASRYHAN